MSGLPSAPSAGRILCGTPAWVSRCSTWFSKRPASARLSAVHDTCGSMEKIINIFEKPSAYLVLAYLPLDRLKNLVFGLVGAHQRFVRRQLGRNFLMQSS